MQKGVEEVEQRRKSGCVPSEEGKRWAFRGASRGVIDGERRAAKSRRWGWNARLRHGRSKHSGRSVIDVSPDPASPARSRPAPATTRPTKIFIRYTMPKNSLHVAFNATTYNCAPFPNTTLAGSRHAVAVALEPLLRPYRRVIGVTCGETLPGARSHHDSRPVGLRDDFVS